MTDGEAEQIKECAITQKKIKNIFSNKDLSIISGKEGGGSLSISEVKTD